MTTTTMKSKVNKDINKSTAKERLAKAKTDYKKLMTQVEPFLKKSEILFTSTEGKWNESSFIPEDIRINNSLYS